MVRLGIARHGLAVMTWRGCAVLGNAWYGSVRTGGHGPDGLGEFGLGLVRPG